MSHNSNPCNWFLGHTFMPPSQQILSYAKEIGMEGKVHVVTCGVPSQMTEIHHALADCMQAGYWLVLQNAHLADSWSPQLLQLIKVRFHTMLAFKKLIVNTSFI